MSELLLKNARIIDPGRSIDQAGDIGIKNGVFADPGELKSPEVIDLKGLVATPGFIDLHVHLRQPGNSTAETIKSGTMAAAAGGFSSIVAMPNTNPAADNAGAIEYLRQNAAKDGVVKVWPCGCLTKNSEGVEMAGIGALKGAGVVAISDDGKCVQDHALMRHIIEYAASFDLVILDHCEEYTLQAQGVMHEGKWSVLLGMKGIPSASEELIVARDIMLTKCVPGARIHIQHISAAECVEMLRKARGCGVKISGEVTPHHFTLTDETIRRYDTNYKMNPPLRSESDRVALIAGLKDGTIEVIATDHAPHTETAKMVEFDHAPFGIIGLETALGVSMTELYHAKHLKLPELIAKFTSGPAKVLGWSDYSMALGNPADVTVIDPDLEWTVDKRQFRSKSRNTPFDGYQAKGRAVMTIVNGKVIFKL